MPSGGMSLPVWEVFAVPSPGGAACPRPVERVRAGLPALALPVTLWLRRTLPSGKLPRVPPRVPIGSLYWMPPEPTTSGNLSPFRSR